MATESVGTWIRYGALIVLIVLASVGASVGGATPGAEASDSIKCFAGIVEGEVCAFVVVSCDEDAANRSRSGFVTARVNNLSEAPVEFGAIFGDLAPRFKRVEAGRSGDITVSGRSDGALPVQLSIAGYHITGDVSELRTADALVWCSASPELLECEVDATTVRATFDNTASALSVDVSGKSGFDPLAPEAAVGTIGAGATTVVSFTPEDPLRFTLSYLAEGASESLERSIGPLDCEYELSDCEVTTPSIPVAECEAVLDVFAGLGWDPGQLRTDLCTGSPRVHCRDGHVRRVELIDECPISCDRITEPRTLSPSITRLEFLERLRIVYNTPVRGTIPPQIGQLPRLERLILDADFEGEIPAELGNLDTLVELVIENNPLTGSIPESFANLTSLQSLDLSGNQLDGPIPPVFDGFTALRRFDLADNLLTGTVPSSVFQTGIDFVDLSGNQLDSLPAEGGPIAARPEGQSLLLDDNQITGPLPAWFATLDIEWLSMSNNRLSGPVSDDIGTWPMGLIDLSSNQLSGPIPDGVGQLTLDRGLDLSDNQLSGPIPPTVGDITWLPDGYDRTFLDLRSNQLSGELSPGMAARGLEQLLLADNDLVGSIPVGLIGRDMVTLDLARNQLSGTLDPSLFVFDGPYALRELDLAANRLTGALPEAFPRLDLFDISDNSLSGTIPESMGRIFYLDMSNNDLTGPITPAIVSHDGGPRNHIGTVRLGGNQLSGPLPDTLQLISSAGELSLLPNGCLTASRPITIALLRIDIDASRLCEEPGMVQFCRDRVVTVDLLLGEVPTDGDDVILGTVGDDVIAAGDGDDLVCGLAGDDRIWGQGGNDEIHGDGDGDFIRGGPGNDLLFGHDGNDDMRGGAGDDEVWGQGDHDRVAGGTGDDLVHGGAGSDGLVAGNGGSDEVFGGDGFDWVTGGPRADVLSGGAGNDNVKGNGGPDELSGNAGDDSLFGGPQSDVLDGGDGTDECNGGTNNDVVPDTTVRCESTLNIP